MIRKIYYLIIPVIVFVLTPGCTSDTGTIGIIDVADSIVTKDSIYNIYTYTDTIDTDSIPFRSAVGYLGRLRDPETGIITSASFATQYGVQVQFSLPDSSAFLCRDEEGYPIVDSVDVSFYLDEVYGDPNNPMIVEVYPLKKVITKADIQGLGTDILTEFVDRDNMLQRAVFSYYDHNYSDEVLNNETHSNHIHIALKNEIGNRIMKAYYDHPEYFTSNYAFINNVLKGIYIMVSSGEGTYCSVSVSAINLYFRYTDYRGKIQSGFTRFSGTAEVIQCSELEGNNDRKSYFSEENKDITFLKNPDGVVTSIILPVDDIFAGHEHDSISSARLLLPVHNVLSSHSYSRPGNVLLLQHKNRYKFFKENLLPNNAQYLITALTATYNAYEFSNISRLLNFIYRTHKEAVLNSPDGKDPDEKWNVVDLIPVTATSNNNSYTSTAYCITPTTARLTAGTRDNPLKIQVIYSRFY